MVCDSIGPTTVRPSALSVRLLGPVAAVVDGREVAITARRQRSVLACLALHTGETVSADRLLDEVWGDDLPDTRARAVAFQISKLRGILEPDRNGEGTLITTSPGGYTLRADPDDVDVHRFDRLVDDARAALAGDPARSSRLLDEAVLLWRGRPFADLGDEPFTDAERHRLEQRQLLARRTQVEAAVALGRHLDIIGDLEVMLAEHPLDESVVRLAMLALQHAGRVADALRTYGEFRMRLGSELGIEPSLDLQALEAQLLAGVPSADRSARPDVRSPRRVPSAPTALIGRTAELAGIVETLSSARVVTLCGFGGLGKTRLALEVANTHADQFADGVWFVDLTSIDDGRLCVDTFLASGGVPADGREPVDRLIAHLADRELLVVVDNCEHVIDDVAELITQVVRGAPRVRVLATSRLGLGIGGEALWTVHPLAPASAVQMFVDHARLARPGFVAGETNRDDLERLGEHLDGIPLAIEMAAARLSVLTVAQICEHLDDRLAFLTRTGRKVEDRQRSLEAVLEWSYRLLDDEQQTLLRRISVCTGGFTLDAALAIGVPDDDATLTEVLDRLGHLVEASLVVFDDHDPVPRYRMLDTVRTYAAGQLDRDGGAERTASSLAHAVHFARVAAEMSERRGQDAYAQFRLGDHEIGNLEAAIAWTTANGHPRVGLTIMCRLWSLYVAERWYDAAMRNLQVGLEATDEVAPDILEAAALSLIAANNSDCHEWHFLERMSAMIEDHLGTVDDPTLRSILLRGLAAYVGHSEPSRSDTYLREAATIPGASPTEAFLAVHNRVATTWWFGRLDDPEATLRQIDALVDAAPAMARTADYLRLRVAMRAGWWDVVIAETESSDHLSEYAQFHRRISRVEALIALGRADEAADELRRLELIPSREHVHTNPYLWASLELERGDPGAAVIALRGRIDELGRDPRRLALGAQLTSLLGEAAHSLGHDETAAVLFGYSAAEQRRLEITLRPTDRPRAERAVAACRAALTERRFDELAARGAVTDFVDLPPVDVEPATGTA